MLLLESCCHCYCQPFVFLYCLRGEYLKYIYVCAYIAVYKWLKSSIGRRLCYCTQNVWSLSYSCSSDGGKPRAWTLWRQVTPKTEKWTLTYNLCQTMRVTFLFADASPGPGRWVTSSDWQVMKSVSSKSSKQAQDTSSLPSYFRIKKEEVKINSFCLAIFPPQLQSLSAI